MSRKKRDERIIYTPPGVNREEALALLPSDEKTSSVILRFAQPLLDEADIADYDIFHSCISIAIIAWNTALLSPDERRKSLMDIIKKIPMIDRLFYRRVLDTLIRRKETEFPEFKWVVVDFNIIQTPKTYKLTVQAVLTANAVASDNADTA